MSRSVCNMLQGIGNFVLTFVHCRWRPCSFAVKRTHLCTIQVVQLNKDRTTTDLVFQGQYVAAKVNILYVKNTYNSIYLSSEHIVHLQNYCLKAPQLPKFWREMYRNVYLCKSKQILLI